MPRMRLCVAAFTTMLPIVVRHVHCRPLRTSFVPMKKYGHRGDYTHRAFNCPPVRACLRHNYRNYHGLFRASVPIPPPRTTFRPLSSSSSASSFDNGDVLRRYDSLDNYLSQLNAKGELTAEEVHSMSSALANAPNDDTTKIIIVESIDAYISINNRRLETGGEPIGNPGPYVRSIARKKLEEETGEKSEPPHVNSENAKMQVDPVIQTFMQNNDIGPNEIEENCLMALSRCPTPMAENALKAYATQKRRREVNGMEKISDPSSYVMAVLRNNMADTTALSLAPSPKSNPSNNASPQEIIEKELGSSAVASPPPMTKSDTSNFFDSGVITTPPQEMLPQQRTDQHNAQQSLGTRGIQERKDKTAAKNVSMEYVESCLSKLAKLEQPIIQLSGVGPKTELAFQKLGIYSLRDLLWHFPRSFIDRSMLQKSIHDVADGDVGTFRLKINKDKARSWTDEAGNNVDVTFFYGRSRQGMIMTSTAMKKLRNEDEDFMIVSGKIKHSCSGGRSELFNPDIVVTPDQADSLGIESVYALSSGLTRKKLIAAVEEALAVAGELLNLLPESLPHDVLEKLRWPKLAEALVLAHKPTSMSDTGLDSPARRRLAFEEMSMQQAQLALLRWKLKCFGVSSDTKRTKVFPSWRDSPLVSTAVSSLPFDLSPGQLKCLDEMWSDAIVGGDSRMLRLLQGDVGSGKTVLAYLLGLGCIESRQGGGRAVSILCPTQLLASQHVKSISSFAALVSERSNWNIHVELLTGNVVGKSRDELLARLDAASESDAIFLIGTHVLTTPDICARLKQLPSVSSSEDSTGLALAVVDEEQRFGVLQREAFTNGAAHSLFMSATPIPRSISLANSGLMDLTLLDSFNTHSVETTIVSSDTLDKVLTILSAKITAGSKCFWVLPRIEQSKNDDGEDDHHSNVIDRHSALAKVLGEERVCHVHGRMIQQDREEQLDRFTNPSSKAAVLVGTTVIEVGIDIPDVDIIIIEEADRFGLSQLHQLRGRIGRAGSRSELKCHCLLLSSTIGDNKENSFPTLTRLQILQRSKSGSEIAEADLLLRGPGDILGFSQSGMENTPYCHLDLLVAATKFGRAFLQQRSNRVTADEVLDGSHSENDILVNLLDEGKIESFYNQTSASSLQGFALRAMMVLFNESNTVEAIDTIQTLEASKGELSQDEKVIHAKVIELTQSFSDETVSVSRTEPQRGLEATVLPSKPHVVAPIAEVPRLSKDDVLFIVLDVETTGLDDKSSYIIQLAAKVLGSDDEKDIFSEYILPPIDQIPKKIEELTGITDDFLRHGGYDSALGKEIGTARNFRHVFLDFQAFCIEQAKTKKCTDIVLVAHNAKFDVRMMNGELRRWRFSEHSSSAPNLGDIFSSSLDTLQLFRERQWWRSSYGGSATLPRPTSFSLGALHSHVFNESIENSHNAVGDINALERLLLSNSFSGWERRANKIQSPFIRSN